MAKVALITDTHAGVRGDSKLFLDNANRFYQERFFPELEKRGIETVIHLGDVFDRRKYINFHTLHETKKHFLEPLSRYETHIIIGNHDCFYKDTNGLNSVEQLAGHYGFRVYTEATDIEIGGMSMLFVPWICAENHNETMERIARSRSLVCMGHLQIQGFEMHVGSICQEGLMASTFDKFSHTFSGHFHKKSSVGSIHYLGTPFQWTWADHGEIKGFHIFDTVTGDLEFVGNPQAMFQTVVYDDAGPPTEHSMETFRDAYVRIIVQHKGSPYQFDLFREKFEMVAHDVKIIDPQDILVDLASDRENEERDVASLSDSFSMLRDTIATEQNLSVDKGKLEAFLLGLYNKALNNEVS